MDAMQFCVRFAQLVNEGRSYAEIGMEFDMSYASVYLRARNYRKKGINLPVPMTRCGRLPININAINRALKGM